MAVRQVKCCDKCGKTMEEGFSIAFDLECYCSEECLYDLYSVEMYENMNEDGISYYTKW